MTKTCSTMATIQRTHHIIAMLIRRSLENLRTKLTLKIMKKVKGIKKNVIKNNIRHEDYKNTLINNKQMHHKMKTIGSQKYQLESYEINKVSLSCFDDKRYIHDIGGSSYAYGHYKIE